MKGLILKIAGVMTALSLPLVFSTAVRAAADTCTWTGGGADDNFSTAANWSDSAGPVVECDNGNIPEAGDTLNFPANILDTNDTPVNDMTAGTSFAQFTFTGSATEVAGQTSRYTISGNSVTLTGGITNSMTTSAQVSLFQTLSLPIVLNGNQTFSVGTTDLSGLRISGNLSIATFTLTYSGSGYSNITGVLSGSGAINFVGSHSVTGTNTGFTGQVNIAANAYVDFRRPDSLGATSVNLTVASNGNATLCGSDNGYTYTQDITIGGDGPTAVYDSSEQGALNLTKMCGAGAGGTYVPATTTLSGTVTLSANTLVKAGDNLKITGPLTGSFTIGALPGSTGSLIIESSANTSGTPNGTQAVVLTTTTYSDAKPTDDLNVGQTDIAVLTGTRKDVYVNGTLKGTGTISGTLSVAQGAKLAPGLSPGCINSGNLVLSGTYEVELADLTACTEYDQTNVTGTVDLTSSTLSIIRFDGMVPRLNDSFTIILNDGTDAVTGTFTGIAQGGTIVSGGITYSVSYTGGTGNDVVLVVTAVDSSLGAPNTGVMQIVKSGTILPILAILAAFVIVGVNFVHKKQ
jgi:fibronectin-binding autotransporter adhesin